MPDPFGSKSWAIFCLSYEGLWRLGMDGQLSISELMRDSITPIARTTEGTGVSFLMCKRATRDFFGMDKFPVPKDYGVLDPTGQYRMVSMGSSKRGANNLNLRIAYEWRSGGKKPHMVRVRIAGNPIMDTVQVLTNLLNESGVDWLYIANANGNRLSRSYFHSDALWGKGRACSG